MVDDAPEYWICLAGGSALGAFHWGAIEALLDSGISAQRVAGASAGAVMAALWLGGARETAKQRMETFWRRATDSAVLGGQNAWRQAGALRALLGGKPDLFVPVLPGFWAISPLVPDGDHLHSTAPLRRTLLDLIDFDRLNDGDTRLIVTALDQQTGEDVVFDSAEMRLEVDHLMASTAFPLVFPPVEIDGRLLIDPGLSANLPVSALFRDRPRQDVLCRALDLWPPGADRPGSLDAVARRIQDLLLSTQSRHALERVAEVLSPDLRKKGLCAVVHHMGYDGGDWEVAVKAFDFSTAAIQRRRAAGNVAMAAALSAPSGPTAPGLHLMQHGFCG